MSRRPPGRRRTNCRAAGYRDSIHNRASCKRDGPAFSPRVKNRQIRPRDVRPQHLRGLSERERQVRGTERSDESASLRADTRSRGFFSGRLPPDATRDDRVRSSVSMTRPPRPSVPDESHPAPILCGGSTPYRLSSAATIGRTWVSMDCWRAATREAPTSTPARANAKIKPAMKRADFRVELVNREPCGRHFRSHHERAPPPLRQQCGFFRTRAGNHHGQGPAQPR